MQEELIAVSEVLQYNIDRAVAETQETTWISDITNLARNAGISLTRAMSLLQIPEQKQQDLLALMEEKQQSPS